MNNETIKVIFEPLPKESLWIRLWRAFTYSYREYKCICISMNEQELIIKRGVVIDVPKWVPEVSSRAPQHMKYNCYVQYKQEVK